MSAVLTLLPSISIGMTKVKLRRNKHTYLLFLARVFKYCVVLRILLIPKVWLIQGGFCTPDKQQ